jgi:hypothetical protein
MKPTFFESPAEFRAWLDKNDDDEPELLVGFRGAGSGMPSITWKESVDEAAPRIHDGLSEAKVVKGIVRGAEGWVSGVQLKSCFETLNLAVALSRLLYYTARKALA